MRTRWIITIVFAIFLLGYVIGTHLPIRAWSPENIGDGITRNEYLTRAVAGLGVIATLCATLVALFKEDLIGLIRSAKLRSCFRDKESWSELTVQEQSNDGSGAGGSIVAKRYELVVAIVNDGKVAAKGCHVFLERLTFHQKGTTAAKQVFVADPATNWLNRPGEVITLPRGSRAFLALVAIDSPDSSLVEASAAQVSARPKLTIGRHEFGDAECSGVYVAEFAVHSENAGSLPFTIQFEWTGGWDRRLSEMKARVKIKAKGIDHGE